MRPNDHPVSPAHKMKRIAVFIDLIFNAVEKAWKGDSSRRKTGLLLALVYLVTLALIELKLQELLPSGLADLIPGNHFRAIDFAFSMVLIIEIVDLVFSIAHSFSESMGKQLEIYSLILLRTSFKELSLYHEPLQWPDIYQSILPIISNAGGALVMFASLGIYYRVMNSRPITRDSGEQFSFIASKKAVCLFLILLFPVLGIYDFRHIISRGDVFPFFDSFYTILIFTDILVLIISMRYTHTYMIVFRNSGFTLATIMVRLGLTAPHYYNVVVGILVSAFVLSITLLYNRFSRPLGEA